eukprot:snap_masked-scaffold_50-processed-gene-0.33-mRNA-1 protein AED:1.00 eAED:1.00 QI:0/0/0/0/1/1/2/0/62
MFNLGIETRLNPNIQTSREKKKDYLFLFKFSRFFEKEDAKGTRAVTSSTELILGCLGIVIML